MTEMSKIQKEAWRIAEEKGFHEGRERAKVLALIHSEVSEALEADRVGDEENYAEELADIVIRVMDHCETEGIDLESEIIRKNKENRQREHKHGKKY